MKSTLDQIEDIKKNGFSLDFSSVFNHAFENYKKIALYSGLIILVLAIIIVMAYMGILIAYFGIESLKQDYLKEFTNQNFTGVELLVQTIGFSLLAALIAPFGAGFLKMADSADKDIEFNVSTMFYYYKGKYFAQIFVAAIITAITGNLLSNLIRSLNIPFGELIAFAIPYIISYFVYLSTPLIIFGNLTAIESLKASIIIVTKNPLNIFAFFIIGFLGALVGLVACCVGVIFTAVFNSSMQYATYFAIFGTHSEEEDSIDSIGKYNVD
ncbi:hypothetical protein BB050_02874 [Flavobacterium anhuiense]|uniref:Beta-carotene 15,15'-monooxygenase n=1 Tax=Flavobacterium anhuiense TaxID=459526 RepID=A0AAC9D3T1_9FLAO|nr:hypothetical protein [Flavobacterium anhuiense]AOC95967.1 hypothetical protein BB050_02874 [Flavobacterium anhuiense]URM36676.1 hypothetical protein LLY39_20095 [Flavobacterium anhuiense]SCY63907.1 hypothetical protein SAMN02927916_2718 [Flavobacterium anhuiense]